MFVNRRQQLRENYNNLHTDNTHIWNFKELLQTYKGHFPHFCLEESWGTPQGRKLATKSTEQTASRETSSWSPDEPPSTENAPLGPTHCKGGTHRTLTSAGKPLLVLATCAQLEIRQTQRCGACHLLPSLQRGKNGAPQKPLLHVFSGFSDSPPTQCSILIIF